ncbi:MAG: hypothetical protein LBT39_06070 [Treponema sp.]|nr:hypothetical protein [Treponema sp.]
MEKQVFDESSVRALLTAVPALPPELGLPTLRDLAALRERAAPAALAAPAAGLLGGRLDRRYRRIRFAQGELGRLDFSKAAPGTAFDDFVFAQIDFSIYQKIPAEEFALFSECGLEDFEDAFFPRFFRMDRKAVATLIAQTYRPLDGFAVIKEDKLLKNPLLMAVMRTLHTSLEFAPLLEKEAVLRECNTLLRFLEQAPLVGKRLFHLARGFGTLFAQLLLALDGARVIHADGMITGLSAASGAEGTVLKGTFRPHRKAYTIPLAAAP